MNEDSYKFTDPYYRPMEPKLTRKERRKKEREAKPKFMSKKYGFE